MTKLKQDIKKHWVDYLILIFCGILFLTLLKIFQGERTLSFIITVFFAIFYVVWAIFHHKRDEVLRFKNVIEYILIGFTIVILASVIL